MKYTICYISTILHCLLILSCSKDWFDIKSDKNITIPTTLKDYELLLDNFSVINTYSSGLADLASDEFYITEATWNILSTSNSEINWNKKNGYTWSNNGTSYRNLNDWNKPYSVISYCNIVLEGLNKIKPNDTNKKQYNSIMGNALFHRARSYWDLSQTFAKPFNKDLDSPYGIPLKKDASSTSVPLRASVHETYEFIINDLIKASNLLPPLPQHLSRGSAAACNALLSRIFLTTKDYPKSIQYATAALKITSTLIDYNSLSNLQELGLKNKEMLFISYITNYTFNSPRNAIVDSALIKAYSENDLRKVLFFRLTTNGHLFKGMYNDIPFNSACIATDEVYLNRAEAFARMNQIPNALNDIKTLLINRYKRGSDGISTYKTPPISGLDETLKYILFERRKELLFRGIRWSDLRRLNQEKEYATKIMRIAGGQIYSLSPNSDRYTFPIPLDEIGNFQQNPGW